MYFGEYQDWHTAHVDKVHIYKDASGEWRWKYVRSNGRIMADSGEGYKNRVDCVEAAEFVFRARDEFTIEFKED